MKIVNKIRAKENTFFARLRRGFSEKPDTGLYKADI